jgi:hypothetical protein
MLHSVINIPSFENVHNTSFCLYHTSFSDFLTNASHSGEFFIEKEKALVEIIKHSLL